MAKTSDMCVLVRVDSQVHTPTCLFPEGWEGMGVTAEV